MSGEALVTQKQLENRIGKKPFRRMLDDDNEGEASKGAVAQLIADCSAEVWSKLPRDFVLPSGGDPQLTKMALDVAQGLLFTRHPEFQRDDGLAILKEARKMVTEHTKRLEEVSEAATAEGGGAVVSGSTTAGSGTVSSGESAFVSGSGNPWLR